MSESGQQITLEDVLNLFDGLDDGGEPLPTIEVAEQLDCSQSSAYDKLEAIAEQCDIKSKQIGPQTRVWWRAVSITEQNSAEEPLHDQVTSPESHLNNNNLLPILEASPVSLVIVEPSGKISFANERAEKMLGLERSEITGRTYRQSEWKIYYDDGTPVPVEEHPVTRVLETGEPDYGFEHWIELPDGTERWLSSNSAPVLNDEGEVKYVVVGFEDTTPLKDREDKLTSEKRRYLEFHSDQLFQPFLDVADGEVRIDVDDIITRPDGKVLHYITATGISANALSDVFTRHFDVLDARLLRSINEQCRFELLAEVPTLPWVFDEFGGRVNCLVWIRPDEMPVITGELPGDVDPRTMIQEAQKVYSDIELKSQHLRYTPRLLYDIVEEALTDRQFMVLLMAYYGGYFDTPRKSTGVELADQLDITRQAFNQHLRKAEFTVYEKLFEASGEEAR